MSVGEADDWAVAGTDSPVPNCGLSMDLLAAAVTGLQAKIELLEGQDEVKSPGSHGPLGTDGTQPPGKSAALP